MAAHFAPLYFILPERLSKMCPIAQRRYTAPTQTSVATRCQPVLVASGVLRATAISRATSLNEAHRAQLSGQFVPPVQSPGKCRPQCQMIQTLCHVDGLYHRYPPASEGYRKITILPFQNEVFQGPLEAESKGDICGPTLLTFTLPTRPVSETIKKADAGCG